MFDAESNPLEDEEFSESNLKASRLALGLFGCIAVFVIADVAHDASLGAEAEHLAVELLLMGAAIWGTLSFWKRWQRERHLSRATLIEAHIQVARWQGEAERWREEAREALQGLAKAIDEQFQRWSLSPAEQEVALLLLKGLSLKEVAGIRETSERTVRQQAASVYKKGQLAGRAELSAFFLEDLLLPSSE